MAGLKYDTQSKPPAPKKLKRIHRLAEPRKTFSDTEQSMPQLTKTGTRMSAIAGRLASSNSEIAWPYVRRLLILKKMYKNRFSPERLERIDRMIEAANATIYTKLANCGIDLKKYDGRDLKKKKAWSETDWKRRMDYISQIAAPKKVFEPPPVMRGKSKPLEEIMSRIDLISSLPSFKCYKRMSQENWYRNPEKVAPNALKYVITERTKKLATPRAAQGDQN